MGLNYSLFSTARIARDRSRFGLFAGLPSRGVGQRSRGTCKGRILEEIMDSLDGSPLL